MRNNRSTNKKIKTLFMYNDWVALIQWTEVQEFTIHHLYCVRFNKRNIPYFPCNNCLSDLVKSRKYEARVIFSFISTLYMQYIECISLCWTFIWLDISKKLVQTLPYRDYFLCLLSSSVAVLYSLFSFGQVLKVFVYVRES